MFRFVGKALGWAAQKLSRTPAATEAGEQAVQAASRFGFRRLLGFGAAGAATAEVGSRALTGEGVLPNIATAGGDAAQRVGEEAARAAVNAENHGFAQKLINWGNNVQVFLGNGPLGEFLGDLLRGFGMQIQGATHALEEDLGEPVSNLSETFGTYANGLAEDFDPSQWSVEGGLNLVNAAGNGAVVGVTSTLGWAAGQALDIVNVGDWFSDRDFSTEAAQGASNITNRAWNATVGAPDLSGHWAHAINGTAGFAAPAVGLLRAGRFLSQAFGLANATTGSAQVANVVTRNAPAIVISAP